MSVFIPPALLSGISGEIYRQFALTIAVSTFFSAVNALTLSPTLCALLLKPHDPNAKQNWFNARFNAAFQVLTDKVGAMVAWLTRRFVLASLLFVGGLALMGFSFVQTPTAFVPNEDQGLLLVDIRLPPGASQARVREAFARVTPAITHVKGVRSFLAVSGFSLIAGPSSNHGFGLVSLEGWDARAKAGRGMPVIKAEVARILGGVEAGLALPFELPPVPGLGTGAALELHVLDRASFGSTMLAQVTNDLIDASRSQARIAMAMTSFVSAAPQMRLQIDRELVRRMDVPIENVFGTLQSTLGSTYVNDFNLFGRTYQVRVSADDTFRRRIEDLFQFEVRNASGNLVPLGAFVRATETAFPPFVERFNLYPSTTVQVVPAPGVSSGDGIDLVEQVARDQLPEGMTYAWASVAYQEKLVQGQIVGVFGLALLVVFLILAAQYESWSYPFAIVFTIPFAVLGAMIGIISRGIPNDIFVQAGLVLLVGLSAKNAILIVEVAKEMKEAGMEPVEAAIKAREQRFRPIVMTSLAFILGVVPLVIASGAGANSRRSLGTAVFGGMIFETFVGMFASPFLFVAVCRAGAWYEARFGKKKDVMRSAHASQLLTSAVAWIALATMATAQTVPRGLEGSDARREAANEEAAESAQSVLHVGDPSGLTADDAARMAAESSPRLDAARANTAAAHAATNDALAGMLPEFDGRFDISRLGRIGPNAPLEQGLQDPAAVQNSINQTADPNAQAALQAMYDQIETAANTTTPVPVTRYALTARASYPVLRSLIAGLPTYRAAGKQEEASRIREATELQSVMQEARETYYEYGRALAAVRIAEQQIEASRSNLETVRSQARSGAATPADVALLEAQLATHEVDLARAEGDRDRVAIALAAFVTRGDIGDFRASFGEDLSAPVAGPDGDYDHLLDEAIVHRTELAMLREQVSAARDQLRAAGRLRLPEFSVQLEGTYANPNLIYFPWEPTWRGNWLLGARLSWSLQTFMHAQVDLQRTNAQMASLVAEHERVLDAVRTEVAAGRANLVAAQRGLRRVDRGSPRGCRGVPLEAGAAARGHGDLHRARASADATDRSADTARGLRDRATHRTRASRPCARSLRRSEARATRDAPRMGVHRGRASRHAAVLGMFCGGRSWPRPFMRVVFLWSRRTSRSPALRRHRVIAIAPRAARGPRRR